jgi:hypothetical protein
MGSFDANTLKSLKEMLPTADETSGLKTYMKPFLNSEEDKAKGYADFSECEKYMYTVSKDDLIDIQFSNAPTD